MFLLQGDSSDRPGAAGNCRFNLLLVSFPVKNLAESTFSVGLNRVIDRSLAPRSQKSVLLKARVLMAALFSHFQSQILPPKMSARARASGPPVGPGSSSRPGLHRPALLIT